MKFLAQAILHHSNWAFSCTGSLSCDIFGRWPAILDATQCSARLATDLWYNVYGSFNWWLWTGWSHLVAEQQAEVWRGQLVAASQWSHSLPLLQMTGNSIIWSDGFRRSWTKFEWSLWIYPYCQWTSLISWTSWPPAWSKSVCLAACTWTRAKHHWKLRGSCTLCHSSSLVFFRCLCGNHD